MSRYRRVQVHRAQSSSKNALDPNQEPIPPRSMYVFCQDLDTKKFSTTTLTLARHCQEIPHNKCDFFPAQLLRIRHSSESGEQGLGSRLAEEDDIFLWFSMAASRAFSLIDSGLTGAVGRAFSAVSTTLVLYRSEFIFLS